MINSNKRWLLTASPWMRGYGKLSRSVIGGMFFSALLALHVQTGIAQVDPVKTSKGGPGHTTGAPGTVSVMTAAMPANTAATTTTCVGTHITLSNTMAGGTWSVNNSNVTITPSGTTVDVLGVNPGTTSVVTYTVGIYSVSTTVTVMGNISGPASVCTGNTITLTDVTPTGIWTSSNPAAATVSVAGVITGVASGATTITYQRISDHATCFVTTNVTVSTNSAVITPALPIVCVGGTTTLTGTPAAGTWSSSNAALATIGSSSGIATGLAAGNPTMTYTAPTGCYATKTLVVNGTHPAAIGGTPVVCIGNTTTLTDATPLGTWSSSDNTLATVNAAGIVTGVAVGNPTITYTKSGCSSTTTVTVNANITTPITGNTNVCVSGTTVLNNSTVGGVWSTTSALVSLSGSTGSSVTVTAGVSTGTAIVTYGVPGGCYQSITLTINPSTSVGAISGSAVVCQNSSVTLTDAVRGGTWSSDNTAVGSVDAYGNVKGVSAGTFNVIYSRLGCTSTQAMTVNAVPTVTGTLTLCNAADVATTQVTLTPTPAGGTWASSNTAVANVGSATGIVAAVSDGTVNISYTSTVGCTTVKVVTVNGPAVPVATGGILTTCLPLLTGGIGTYVYLGGAPTGGTWSSSNTTIATVASDGTVTGKASGTANITYTQGGCASKVTVTVNPSPVLITGTAATCVGSTTALSDTSGGGTGTWTSSNTAIGTVSSSGVVYGVAPGGTTVSYTLNGCSQSRNVTVGAPLNPITSLSATGFTVCTSYAKDTLATSNPGGAWTASSGNVLVSGGTSTAVVTGYATGTSVITYSLNGCYTTTTVTVIANGTGSITGVPFSCIGNATTLTSTTTPGVWSVRDPIATAITGTPNSTGYITGVSAGTTVVTYTNPTNGCFKTMVFNVQPQPAPITATPLGAASFCMGSTFTLSDATTGGTWSSSNTHIATVGSTGVVSGMNTGLVTITYSSPGGCYSIYPVDVMQNPMSIVYKSKHYGAVCSDGANPGHIAIAYDSTTGGTWSCPRGLVTFGTTAPYGNDSFQVIGGTITGNWDTATIIYTLPNGCFTTTTVTVGAVTPSFSDPNNATPWNYCQGGTLDTLQLGGTYNVGLRAWTVLNKGNMFASNIASISNYSSTFAGGGIQGLLAGVATVTYTYNGCWATQDVTVNPNPSVGISGPSALCTTGLGNTYTLTDGSYSGGTWVSNNTGVATVNSSGLATGVAVGSAIISYAVRYGGCIDVLPVNVNSLVPAAITPTVNPTPVCVGSSTTLSDATAGGSWSSSNSSLASIDAIGIIYGVAGGSVTITYGIGGCYVVQLVTVNTLPTFTGAGQLCAGNSATLNPTPAGGTWSTRTTNLATIGSTSGIVTATPTGNGDTVSVNYTYNGCTFSAIDTIGAAVTTFTMSPTLCSNAFVAVTPVPSSKWVNTWTSSNPSVAFAGGAGTFATGSVTGVPGSGGGVVTISYTPPGCTTTYTTTVNVLDVGTITSSSFAVCSTGVAAVTTVNENAGGGTWALSNTNAALSGSTGTSVNVTGSVPGYDTLTYAVVSGATTCKATQQITIIACGPKESNEPGSSANIGEQRYTLFPNPGNGRITIRQSEAVDGMVNLNVINYLGATIYSGSVDFAGGQSQIDLSGASAGMYLVMLKDSKGHSQTFKMIIDK